MVLPTDNTWVIVYCVLDTKYDGCQNTKPVAFKCLRKFSEYSINLIVVSLCGLHYIIFLTELNNIYLLSTNNEKAYLGAITLEKFYKNTGSEFGVKEATL